MLSFIDYAFSCDSVCGDEGGSDMRMLDQLFQCESIENRPRGRKSSSELERALSSSFFPMVGGGPVLSICLRTTACPDVDDDPFLVEDRGGDDDDDEDCNDYDYCRQDEKRAAMERHQHHQQNGKEYHQQNGKEQQQQQQQQQQHGMEKNGKEHGKEHGMEKNGKGAPPVFYPFMLPVHYLDDSLKHTISPSVSSDLELSRLNSGGRGDDDGGGGGGGGDDGESRESMYAYLFSTTSGGGGGGGGTSAPSNLFGKILIQDWDSVFTHDVAFLQSSQQIVRDMDKYNLAMTTHDLLRAGSSSSSGGVDASDPKWTCEKVMEVWTATNRVDPQEFLDKYCFLDWTILKHLNNSAEFMQVLSVMNLSSPLLALAMPVFLFFVPFLLLKMRDIPITYDVYVQTLRETAKHHFLGKALMCMEESSAGISITAMAYLVMIASMYCLQMYNNFKAVLSFYRNISRINDHLFCLQEYLAYSIHSMKVFSRMHTKRDKYVEFSLRTKYHADTLQLLADEIGDISKFSDSFSKVFEFGHFLKCYYRLHSNPQYGDSLRYSFGFEGYMRHLCGLHANLKRGLIAATQWSSSSSSRSSSSSSSSSSSRDAPPNNVDNTDDDDNDDEESASFSLRNQCYPAFATEEQRRVKNDCTLAHNMIITGPNASGKTTFLKTTMLNVLFSQQVGFGFFDEGSRISPYTHIHSYLNIPDTSERDSLFQAESRRCKEIIDAVNLGKEDVNRHFCIFDELYSGTNPDDAVKTANGFLNYLLKFENVDFLLTTHYVDICRHFEKEKEAAAAADAADAETKKKAPRIENFHMEVEQAEGAGNLVFTYRVRPGISDIHGSLNILRRMDYPDEILQDILAQQAPTHPRIPASSAVLERDEKKREGRDAHDSIQE